MADIAEIIEKQLPNMTDAHRCIARCALDNPMQIACNSIHDLSKITGVSTATIVRFANALGFSGYSAFQDKIKEYCQAKFNPVNRLDKSFATDFSDSDLFSRIYRLQVEELSRMLTVDFKDTIQKAIKRISSASHIYVSGARGSFAVAHYLGHHLNRIMMNSDILYADDRLPDYLARLTPDDVVILVNQPRYDVRLIAAAKISYERGAKVIAITDNVSAPYYKYSDVFFSTPHQSGDFHNSLLPSMLIAELIITMLISTDVKGARRSLRKMEPIFQNIGAFSK